MAVSIEDIRAAAQRISGAVERTPCVHSRTLSRLTGAEVFLKFENLQFTASFKERGALNKLLSLSESERKRGVIAMSAGNHAQAVAYHAARLGIPALIVMPKGSPNTKIKNTQVHGATVVLEGENLFEAGKHARALAARDNLVFVHPYEDPLIIAGQGTTGLEMLEAVPQLEIIVVPVGGGGLISGIATAARSLNEKIQVYGVETRNYPSMYQRLNNLPVECGGDTIAEGIAVKDVGSIALAIIKALVEEVLVVEEETIERAVVALIEIEKTVAEGAGAAGLAALLQHPARFAGKRVGIPISGGNIDSRVLASVLMRGLVRDGRLVRLRVTMPDISGSLAKVAALIAEAGGNIVEIQHQRIFGTSSVRSPEVEFLIETRDRAHTDALVRALEANGVRTTFP
ncbi:MAG: threonine ammonia-lyase [Betaproteobacteria bacterium RIFCSPLOWO2_12_FULL_65_14]|nr:MAG: threonine ammonia-lyase [Betaproteobacteria bacterium RIFCSPLOWO2_12_FULL_65_14]